MKTILLFLFLIMLTGCSTNYVSNVWTEQEVHPNETIKVYFVLTNPEPNQKEFVVAVYYPYESFEPVGQLGWPILFNIDVDANSQKSMFLDFKAKDFTGYSKVETIEVIATPIDYKKMVGTNFIQILHESPPTTELEEDVEEPGLCDTPIIFNISLPTDEVGDVMGYVLRANYETYDKIMQCHYGTFLPDGSKKPVDEILSIRLHGPNYDECTERVPYPKKYRILKTNESFEVIQEIIEKPNGSAEWDGERWYTFDSSACVPTKYQIKFFNEEEDGN